MQRRVYFIITFLVLLIWTAVFFYNRDFKSGIKIGSKAPNFTLIDKNGNEVSLSQYQGKVVLLNFWATWCGPCRHEMPSLEKLNQKYKNSQFTVLGISLDDGGWSDINQFLSQVPVSFPILIDKDQRVSEVYETFRIPETYLISSDGKIAAKYSGPQDFTEPIFSNKIESMLK